MNYTRILARKMIGRQNKQVLAHHLVQSFRPEDGLSAEEIHQIGREWVEELTGGINEYIIGTHIDKNHIHNHILFNSTSSTNFRNYRWQKDTLQLARELSDKIAEKHGAILENTRPYQNYHRNYQKYLAENPIRPELKQRLNFLLKHSLSLSDFLQKAKLLNIVFNTSGKYTTYRLTDFEQERPIRDSSLISKADKKRMESHPEKRIQTFSFSTASLFTDSLEAFKYALKGVEIINQSKAGIDGTITFSPGADMSWSTKLKGEQFGSKLLKNEKPTKKGSENGKQLLNDMQDIQGFFNNPSKNLFDWANFSDILNKYYSMLPEWMRTMNENGVHYDEQLKETGKADLYKYVGDWGTFEIGKAIEKTSLINGSKSFKYGPKEQYRTPNPKGISAGPTVGGTYSLFNWTPPTTWGWSPTVDLVNVKGNSHFNVSKDGFDIGGDALVSAASGGLTYNLNIPGTEWKATLGASGFLGGLGASGHATAEPKEGNFSFGVSGSLGIGGGFNFGISKK